MVIESHDASVDIIGSEPEKWQPQTARDGGPQSALHHGGRVDRWRSDRQAIRSPSVSRNRRSCTFLENVKVERNEELSSLYAKAVANIVHVNLADGRTLTKRVDYPLGNAKNRLNDPRVEGKF